MTRYAQHLYTLRWGSVLTYTSPACPTSASLPCAGQTLLESFCQHLAASWKGTPDSLAVYR